MEDKKIFYSLLIHEVYVLINIKYIEISLYHEYFSIENDFNYNLKYFGSLETIHIPKKHT